MLDGYANSWVVPTCATAIVGAIGAGAEVLAPDMTPAMDPTLPHLTTFIQNVGFPIAVTFLMIWIAYRGGQALIIEMRNFIDRVPPAIIELANALRHLGDTIHALQSWLHHNNTNREGNAP